MLGVDIFFRTKSPLLWPKSLLNYLILAAFQYLPFLFSAFKVNELVCVCFRFSRVNTNSDHSAKLSCSTTAVPTHYSKEMMIQESYDGPIEKTNGNASLWAIEHFIFIIGSFLSCLWFSEKRMSGFDGCNGLQQESKKKQSL